MASVERCDSIACGERVHTRGCGHLRWQTDHQIRIERDRRWNELVVDDGEFPPGCRIGDDGSDGHLRTAARRRRNREERQDVGADLEVAIEVLRTTTARVACDHGLRGVDRRAAADRKDRCRPRRPELLDPRHDDGDGRIGLDLREHRHREASLLQRVQHRGDNPELDEHLIGHNEDGASAAVGDQSGELERRARPRQHERRRRGQEASCDAEGANAET